MLLAIDGTKSKVDFGLGSAILRNANSHVYNFYDDYVGPGKKRFLHGPAGSGIMGDDDDGASVFAIFEEGYQWISEQLVKNPNDPVNLIGHSRGGYIVTWIAQKLRNEGYVTKKEQVISAPGAPSMTVDIPAQTSDKSVPVNFLGLYDAVRMTLGLGADTAVISDNVLITYHARRDPKVHSRAGWGNTATIAVNEGSYHEGWFYTTHSGVGGAPDMGDRDFEDLSIPIEVFRQTREHLEWLDNAKRPARCGDEKTQNRLRRMGDDFEVVYFCNPKIEKVTLEKATKESLRADRWMRDAAQENGIQLGERSRLRATNNDHGVLA